VDGPIRNKAIQIVADEFLAKAASPQVSLPAQRRMKARKTVFISEDDGYYDHSETTTDDSTKGDSSDDETFSPFAPMRKSSVTSAIVVQSRTRSPSLPGNLSAKEDSLRSLANRSRSSSTISKTDIDARKVRPSTSVSDILDSVIHEVDSYLDILSDNTHDQNAETRKK
jgi:hypothetical protein